MYRECSNKFTGQNCRGITSPVVFAAKAASPLRRRIRRALCLSVAFIMTITMSLAMTGCSLPDGGNTTEDDKNNTKTQKLVFSGNPVYSPQTVSYFVPNALEIREEHLDYPFSSAEPASFNAKYLQISGLKNIEVQEKINERLIEIIENQIGYIPPVRGAIQNLGTDYIINATEVYSYEQFSCNNILSIYVFSRKEIRVGEDSLYVDPYNPDSKIYYMYWNEAYNFDLNTGNELKIQDIFCNDIDVTAFLDEEVKKYLNRDNLFDDGGNLYGTQLIINKNAVIPETQKFYIGTNGLYLCFDYASDYISVADEGCYTVMIPWCDKMAITNRFYDGSNIFDAEPQTPIFAQYNQEVFTDVEEIYSDNLGVIKNLRKSVTIDKALPSRFHTLLKEEFKDFDLSQQESVLLALADEINADEIYYHCDMRGSLLGKYAVLEKNIYAYPDVFKNNTGNIEVYDIKTNAILELKDIFKADVDYREVLAEAIIDSINESIRSHNRYIEYLNEGATSQTGQGQIQEINEDLAKTYGEKAVDIIKNFGLRDSYLQVGYDATALAELYYETFGVAMTEDEYSYLYTLPNVITYSIFDADVLAIFQ